MLWKFTGLRFTVQPSRRPKKGRPNPKRISEIRYFSGQKQFPTECLNGQDSDTIFRIVFVTLMYLVEFWYGGSLHKIEQRRIDVFFTAFALNREYWSARFQNNKIDFTSVGVS